MRDAAITFNIDPSCADEATVDYLPFGTRVLKIKVVNTAGPTGVPLVLRPANMPAHHGQAGQFVGHADGRNDLWVSWGGGHEAGPCVYGRDIGWHEVCAPLARGASNYVYLHVTHRPEEGRPVNLSDATLTLLITTDEPDQPVGRLRINLRAPDIAALEDPIRPRWEAGENRITFQGSQIPSYLSRWWPEPRIHYTTAQVPDLSIRYQPLSEPANWPWLRLWQALGIALVGQPGRVDVELGGCPIMTVAGTIEPDLFHRRWMLPELYQFYSPRYLVLRLWFFWLDTHLSVIRQKIHEIPDAERFDVLIDLEQERALYACTDLHWREMWGIVQEQPIRAHIGLSAGKLLQLLGEQIEDEFFDLLVIWDETREVARNPVVALCEALTGHASCNHHATTAEKGVVVRGAGLYAKHSPYFDDETVKLDGQLTSGDVRRT